MQSRAIAVSTQCERNGCNHVRSLPALREEETGCVAGIHAPSALDAAPRMLTLYCELVRLSMPSDAGAAARSSRDAKRLRNAAIDCDARRECRLRRAGANLCACKILGLNHSKPSLEASLCVVTTASFACVVILRWDSRCSAIAYTKEGSYNT